MEASGEVVTSLFTSFKKIIVEKAKILIMESIMHRIVLFIGKDTIDDVILINNSSTQVQRQSFI